MGTCYCDLRCPLLAPSPPSPTSSHALPPPSPLSHTGVLRHLHCSHLRAFAPVTPCTWNGRSQISAWTPPPIHQTSVQICPPWTQAFPDTPPSAALSHSLALSSALIFFAVCIINGNDLFVHFGIIYLSALAWKLMNQGWNLFLFTALSPAPGIAPDIPRYSRSKLMNKQTEIQWKSFPFIFFFAFLGVGTHSKNLNSKSEYINFQGDSGGCSHPAFG